MNRRAAAFVLLLASLPGLTAPRDALAQETQQLANPSALPRRQAENFTWDRQTLRELLVPRRR